MTVHDGSSLLADATFNLFDFDSFSGTFSSIRSGGACNGISKGVEFSCVGRL